MQPKSRQVTIAKRDDISQNLANLDTETEKKSQKSEPGETEKSDTNRSINIVIANVHLPNKRNYFTMTMKTNGIKRKIIFQSGSAPTKTARQKYIKNRILSVVNNNYQDVKQLI